MGYSQKYSATLAKVVLVTINDNIISRGPHSENGGRERPHSSLKIPPNNFNSLRI